MKLAGRGFKNIQNFCCFRADSDVRQPSGLDVTLFGPDLAEGSGVWTSWLDLGHFWARPSTGIGCSGSGFRGAAAEAWGLSWQVKA